MNVDQAEIAKFEALAYRWWDPTGDFRPLHDINPLRLSYIRNHSRISGAKVLDVGCGGGILSESMAIQGACVTGIDMGETPLSVARLHALESGVDLDYRQITAESLAQEQPETFDVVTCLEMLEHVPEPGSVVQACADLAAPGGQLYFSTINRHPKAFALAVVGAEYLLNLLPRGTHDYRKFLTPAELSRAIREAGLEVMDISGMSYNPLTRRCSLTRDVKVNYLIYARKPA